MIILIGGLLGKLFFLNVGVNWEIFMILAAGHRVQMVKTFWGIFIIFAAEHREPSSILIGLLN